MSVVTKRGDEGQTDLMYGRRVPKYAPQVETYGIIDELNATLGLVRCEKLSFEIAEDIEQVQKNLISAMGELATHAEDQPRYDEDSYGRILPKEVTWLEERVRGIEKEGSIRFKGWAIPGQVAHRASALLDQGRTTCRRAERQLWRLKLEEGFPVSESLALFFNRLSDYCWVAARFEGLENG